MHRWPSLLISLCACTAGGCLTALVVAFVCAFWGQRSHQFEYTDQPEMIEATLEQLAMRRVIRRPTMIATTFGLGYRSVGAWLAVPPEGSSAPDEVSTSIGWPNFVIRTSAQPIGNRIFASHQPGRVGMAVSTNMLGTTTILWSGIIFNTLLFSSVIMAVWSCIGWGVLVDHRLLIGVCTVALWMVVLVAWALDVTHQMNLLPRESASFIDPEVFSAEVHAIDHPPSGTWSVFAGNANLSPGYQDWRATFIKVNASNAQILVSRQTEMSLGWPMTALRGAAAGAWEVDGLPRNETRRNHVVRLMATGVSWPGMAVNWVVYAVAILLLLRGPYHLRRFIRLRRGLCAHCGYPTGAAANCTECGAALFARYGEITSCFLRDRVFGQTNGIMGEDPADGSFVFFNAAQFVDASGNILTGSASDYNTYTHANSVLNDYVIDWDADAECNGNPWISNRCCTTSTTPQHCNTVVTKGRCRMNPPPDDLACGHGSTKCTQN